MKATLKIVEPYNGKYELTPEEYIDIRRNESSFLYGPDLVDEIVRDFDATKEEAQLLVDIALKNDNLV